jgi:hypothetical protein
MDTSMIPVPTPRPPRHEDPAARIATSVYLNGEWSYRELEHNSARALAI